jgi:multidrug efflux pump subunit AcrB
MNLKTFIERPVLSAVISIVIVVMGVISLFNLPVERFPDIAPPTVNVSTSYFGASAETVLKSVITPLEEAINGVENMTYMTSNATNTGSAWISIFFKQGTDPDMAAVNVQNRVSRAIGQLPAEVTQVGVSVIKRQNSTLQIFSVYSPDDSFDENFLANYFYINLRPEILRISGVGEVQSYSNSYSMRIWLKPDVMAQYRLVPEDVRAALAAQNIEAAPAHSAKTQWKRTSTP